jgi:hypothetical protein
MTDNRQLARVHMERQEQGLSSDILVMFNPIARHFSFAVPVRG